MIISQSEKRTLTVYSILAVSLLVVAIVFVTKAYQKHIEVDTTTSTTTEVVTTTEPTTVAETTTTTTTTKPTTTETTKQETTSETTTEKKTTTTEKETESTTKEKSSGAVYSASKFRNMGVLHWGGWKWTWYSERVLPGGGLHIPGRHADDNGYICDEDNYICLASSTLKKGTVLDTPLGKQGKIYDSGCASDTIDVYVNW